MSDEVVRAYLYIVAKQSSGQYVQPYTLQDASLRYVNWISFDDDFAAEELIRIAVGIGFKVRG